ncbi:MAG: single-stranded DNA-binding protein [Firmicutes bacterium]|nr:single-stranded DNA-binding protein [Bacillota bacterium]
MLNRVTLIGRLVRDPECKKTDSGNTLARFTLAVDRDFTNSQGKREADFLEVVAWRAQAENCGRYLSKGRLVAVDGRLQVRSYDDSQGIRRKAAEVVARSVVFLPDGKKNQSGGVESPPLPEDDSPNGDVAGGFGGDDFPF